MIRDRFSVYAIALLMVAVAIGALLWLAVRAVGPAVSIDPTPPVVITVRPEPTWSPTMTPFVATPTSTPEPTESVLRPTATFTPIPFITTTPEPTIETAETPTQPPMVQRGP